MKVALSRSVKPQRKSLSWRRWIRPVIGLSVTILFAWLVLERLPLNELPQHLANLNGFYILSALLCLVLGYTARILRWWRMLHATAPYLRLKDTAAPFLIGIAANNVLPLRAGDILRLFAFHDRPGLEPSRIGGTLIVERLLDLLVLLFILMIVLPTVPVGDQTLLSHLSVWTAILGLIGLVGLFCLPMVRRFVLVPLQRSLRLQQSTLALKLLNIGFDITDTIISLGNLRRLTELVLLSSVAWLLEGGVFLSIATAMEIQGGWAVAYTALAIATLATLIPSSPGYIGTFHFFAMQAATFFGNLEAKAATFAIIVHLMLWLPTSMAGALAFLATSFKGSTSKIRL